MVTRMTYAFLPQIKGPYVHATKHRDALYISGLTAFGTDAQSAGLESQTRTVLQQIAAILAAEKRSTADLIKLTIFVRDISQLALIRTLLFDFYGEHLPACSLIEVSSLIHPDLLIEVESIVALA
ncbi:RidA family protein [Dickeya fangzhongdai]|uniref:RidA family protein n=2 Tax=Pectobacteriaceae TaxID=1903410 RepID=A0A2K8QTH9_9GAMM|nr:RidA family protein [Dickeya fangzhongdai]AYH50049.1 enamine deaminase RidA [Dickeya fangzhongdai]MBO8135053.1 RidA family protein [Dickeya fangzhongdai]QOH49842.1 RidA family protein [Dickeya fangzhongdai]QOH54146.1 RidA family protein [Dickeya fangzhongdai]